MVLVWRDLEYSRTSPDRVAYYTFNLEVMHDHAIGHLLGPNLVFLSLHCRCARNNTPAGGSIAKLVRGLSGTVAEPVELRPTRAAYE